MTILIAHVTGGDLPTVLFGFVLGLVLGGYSVLKYGRRFERGPRG
jgi:hypothetical protein